MAGVTDPVPFVDLPANKFPFTVTAYPADSPDDLSPVWTRDVSGPGALHIPGRGEGEGPVRMVISWANGSETRFPPSEQ